MRVELMEDDIELESQNRPSRENWLVLTTQLVKHATVLILESHPIPAISQSNTRGPRGCCPFNVSRRDKDRFSA